MADNVPITAGTGTTVATDELVINALTVHAQIVKPIFGPLDTATFVTATVGMPDNLVQVGGTAILTGNGVAGAGAPRVVIASDNTAFNIIASGAAASGAAKSGNPVLSGSVFNTTQPTVTTGQAVENQSTARGGLIVATGADVFTAAAPATDYARVPATTTSLLISAAATTNATSVKGSAGAVKGIQGYNASTSLKYLKLYNKATAPTVGTDTPVKTLPCPPGAVFAYDFPAGFNFATGIAYAITGAAATADTTALAAGDITCLNVDYI